MIEERKLEQMERSWLKDENNFWIAGVAICIFLGVTLLVIAIAATQKSRENSNAESHSTSFVYQ